MSSYTPVDLHPIMVVQDRYQGVYSGGGWWAVARADDLLDGMTRIQWLMENGPGGDDVTCAVLWNRRPPWVAAAQTPDEAVAALVAQPEATTDSWTPPTWAEDPRAAGFIP